MATVRYTVIENEVLSEKRSGSRKAYIPDALGSTIALVNSSQAKSDTYFYWPYGEARSSTGTTPSRFRFVGTFGYYADNERLGYVRNRQYDLLAGRWLTVDMYWPREPSYSYAAGNPTSLFDPYGTQPINLPDGASKWRFWGLPFSPEDCELIRRHLEYLRELLAKELAKYNKWTDALGGIEHSRGTTKPFGHWKKIWDLRSGIARDIHNYTNFCKPPPPPCRPCPVPIPSDYYYIPRLEKPRKGKQEPGFAFPAMPVPDFSKGLTWPVAAYCLYIIVSEGSRVFPPRNLVPIP